MGIGQLPRITSELKEGGMAGATPIAIVEWATLTGNAPFMARSIPL